ncbi:unnamed protein product [Schistosoma turkestanicum]|nr:unnamed protein product [Schistosoma turkestanicum]
MSRGDVDCCTMNRALSKYGVKPLPRKRAVLLLKEIYHQLHQYEENAQNPLISNKPIELSQHNNHKQSRENCLTKRKKSNHSSKLDKLKTIISTYPIGIDYVSMLSMMSCKNTTDTTNNTTDNSDNNGATAAVIDVDNGDDDDDDRKFNHQQTLVLHTTKTTTSTTSTSTIMSNSLASNAVPNAFNHHNLNSNDEFPHLLHNEDLESSNQTEVNHVKNNNLQQTVLNYLKNNPNLYMNILTYTPLEFDIVHSMLKSDGILIGQQKLMDLFDDQCITFTLRNRARRHRNRGHNALSKRSASSSSSAKSSRNSLHY